VSNTVGSLIGVGICVLLALLFQGAFRVDASLRSRGLGSMLRSSPPSRWMIRIVVWTVGLVALVHFVADIA